MTNANSTKRALLASVMAMLLCFTMLLGTTFAWFTDMATSSGNKIVAGSLKVDLEVLEADNTTWTSVKDSNAAIFDYTNWEPGYTQVKILRVVNEGTLAFKWKATLSSTAGVSDLAKVIEVYVSETITTYPTDRADLSGWDKLGTLDKFIDTIEATTFGSIEPNDAKDANQTLAIAFKMQEDAGNEYQEMTLGEFDLTITATQLEFESDSFGKDYDKDASFVGEIVTLDELKSVIENGGSAKLANDLTLDAPLTVAQGKSVALDLDGNTLTGNIVIDNGGALTVSNGTVANTNDGVSAIQTNGGELTLNNATIESARHGVRAEGGKVTINGGTYKVVPTSAKTLHAVNVSDGATLVINGGTFIGPAGTMADSGAAVNVQAGSTATINGGNFSGGKLNTLAAKGTLTVKGGTFDQDPSAYAAGFTVVNNGNGTYTVTPPFVADKEALVNAVESNTNAIQGYAIDELTLNEKNATNGYMVKFNAAAEDVTIGAANIRATITLSGAPEGYSWPNQSNAPAGFSFPVDNANDFSPAGTSLTFKNIDFINDKDYSKVSNSAQRATRYIYAVAEEVVFENCTFDGGVVVFGDAKFVNCTFKEDDLKVDADGYAKDGMFCLFIDHEYATSGSWTVDLEGCTFDASGYGCVKVAGDRGANITVNVKDCSFTNTCPSNYWSKTTPKYDVKVTGSNITVNDLGGNDWSDGANAGIGNG